MSAYIPLSVPTFNGNEDKYVKDCIDTEWVSSAGKYVDLFEKKIAEYTRSRYAIACVNGTSALQVSLKLVGVKPNDEVIVPTLTFIAPINAIAYNGANPLFMDCDDYCNIDPEKVERFIKEETIFQNGNTYNKITRKKISAIIPVHIWGNLCSFGDLIGLCEERNINVVEDASESLGSFYNHGNYAGSHSGTIGKIGCISFNGNKIITTGGGGMIITDDSELAEKAKYLTTQAKDDPVRYVHNEIGYNFRLTNIHAALGVAQLEQLPTILNKKKFIYDFYRSGIQNEKGISIMGIPNYSESNHWLNLIKYDRSLIDQNIDQIIRKLEMNKIQTRPIWKLNHEQKPYQKNQNFFIEKAKKMVESCLCIPSSPNLNEEDLNRILTHLNE